MALPFGWTSQELNRAASLAATYGAPLEDVLGIWFSESGLNWRNMKGDYGGLIMGRDDFVTQTSGMPTGSWIDIVSNQPLAIQLLAIKRFWDAQIRLWLGAKPGQEESVLKTRAEQIGVTPAGLLYSLNFVPAFASRAKTADGALVRSAELGGGDPNATNTEARYYKDNAPLDVTKKGYISMRDMDIRISAFKNRAKNSPETAQLFVEGSDIIPAAYTSTSESGDSAPKSKTSSFSVWPVVAIGGIFFGSLYVGLHYLEKAIPK